MTCTTEKKLPKKTTKGAVLEKLWQSCLQLCRRIILETTDTSRELYQKKTLDTEEQIRRLQKKIRDREKKYPVLIANLDADLQLRYKLEVATAQSEVVQMRLENNLLAVELEALKTEIEALLPNFRKYMHLKELFDGKHLEGKEKVILS